MPHSLHAQLRTEVSALDRALADMAAALRDLLAIAAFCGVVIAWAYVLA